MSLVIIIICNCSKYNYIEVNYLSNRKGETNTKYVAFSVFAYTVIEWDEHTRGIQLTRFYHDSVNAVSDSD